MPSKVQDHIVVCQESGVSSKKKPYPPLERADQTNQPFSFLTFTNNKSWWAWHATIYYYLYFAKNPIV